MGTVWQTTVAFSLLGAGAVAVAQSTGVPDAPTPQALPRLNSITPTAPAINAPAPQPPAAQPASPDAVPSSLPSTPAPTPQAEAEAQDSTDANAPASSVYRLGTVNVNFVEIPFTVKDSRGALVPGLTYRDVQVYENGLRQQMRLFTTDPEPLSIAIVLDQSMTFDTVQKVNASLDALQGALTSYDEAAIFTYNNGVTEQTGFTGAQSYRLTAALDRSKAPGREPDMAMGGPLDQTTVKNNLPVDPQTNRNTPAGVILETPERQFHTLNDAILTAAQTVARAGKGRRRVIFVISDGKEYGSQAKEKEVIRFLQGNQIAVYATLVGDSSNSKLDFLDKIHLPLQMRDNVLPRYASATGGDYNGAFRPRAIENSFTKLTEEIRTQYTVGYYSHEPFIDGKFRQVDVRVLRPNLEVSAEKGYYPRAEQSGPLQPGAHMATPVTNPAPATAPTQP